MRNLFQLIIIILFVNTSFAQEPCNDDIIMNVKGVPGDQKIILRTSMNTGVSFEPGPLRALTDVLPYAFK